MMARKGMPVWWVVMVVICATLLIPEQQHQQRQRQRWGVGIAAAQSTTPVNASQQDVTALLAIKAAFGNPRTLSSWNDTGEGTCTRWVGVKCNPSGQVVSLIIPGRGLTGALPEAVGNLTFLRKISLHHNAITGPIPQSLGTLPDMRAIALFYNQFSGTIPFNLANSTNLQALDLSYNQLSGEIPARFTQTAKRLYLLDFSHNNLWGGFPYDWASSQSLTQIVLAGNFLSGPLPDYWGNLNASATVTNTPPTQLQSIDVGGNDFSGSIPPTFGTLGNLTTLLLGGNRLQGEIPQELSRLTRLQNLDVSDNLLTGSLPSGLGFFPSTQLTQKFTANSRVINNVGFSLAGGGGVLAGEELRPTNLSSILVGGNQLNGRIPDEIGNLTQLTALNLSHNRFIGGLPASLGNLSKLSTLDLSTNNLSGELPLSLTGLAVLRNLNVSYNNLSGPIPPFTVPFNNSAFEGNPGLCGRPPFLACPSFISPAPAPGSPGSQGDRRHHHRLSTGTIISIALGSALGALALLCLCLLLLWRKKGESKNRGAVSRGGALGAGGGSVRSGEKNGDGAVDSEELGGKLVHFDGPMAFSADHLLCATAEVLGKSAYGTVYKATLEDGNVIAVKRLREGIVKGQKEFESEVGTLGKIRHPNLLALRAYYWGPKDEKLLVFDYMACGSLAAFLHARGPETPLNWETRMKIAMGAARGLGYLHENENIVHGNLTASNILLDGRMNSRISDYGLSRLMTPQAMQGLMASAGTLGYRAPELHKTKKATAKSDVYSFGIVLLELLTGKAPVEQSASESGMDLAEWVSSVVKEEWTSEVFDVEIIKDAPHHQEEEMYNTLQLAMVCVNTAPTARPEMEDVVRQLEEIRPDLRSSPDSHGNSGTESKKEP